MARILVVDDDAHIREVVQYALARDGHEVVVAGDGEAGLRLIEGGGVDLLVLDVVMPVLDGLALCRELRERRHSRLPILFLSSRGEEMDRVLGLELGGDDYLAKPFSPRELGARVKALLRRSDGPGDAPKTLTFGALSLDLGRHEARVGGTVVDLTVTEFGLLRALLEAPGRVLSRADLVARAYAHDNHVTERTIDTHVKRLRAKLRPLGVDPIATVHGVGYRAGDP